MTSAALILFLAFVALVVPALVTLLGRANWWLPRPLARLLGVRAPLP